MDCKHINSAYNEKALNYLAADRNIIKEIKIKSQNCVKVPGKRPHKVNETFKYRRIKLLGIWKSSLKKKTQILLNKKFVLNKPKNTMNA